MPEMTSAKSSAEGLTVLIGLAQGPVAYMNIHDKQVERIRSEFPDVRVVWARSRDEYERNLPDADVAFVQLLTPGDLARAKKLRWVHSSFAGVDKSLFPELVSSDVILTRSGGTASIGIAEQVMGSFVYFARGFDVAVLAQAKRQWARDDVGNRADELFGATVGILGLGDIGREIGRRARTFGMHVLGLRRGEAGRKAPRAAGGAEREYVDEIYGPEGLNELLGRSSYVVLALPLTAETHHLFGEAQFAAMRDGAVLVNIGRGSLVDENALVRALAAGKLRGAALDVFEVEPLPAESPLWGFSNVLVTPHTAGINPSYLDRATDIFCRNLRHFLNGEPLENVVDKKAGY